MDSKLHSSKPFYFIFSGLITGFTEVSAGGGFAIFVGILQIVNGVGFGIAALADFYLLVTVIFLNKSIFFR